MTVHMFQVCDVIASWEKAYLKHASKQDHVDTSRTVKLTYKNRLYFKSLIRSETEKERLLLTYQTNEEIINGRFPLNRDLAVELAALMAQVMWRTAHSMIVFSGTYNPFPWMPGFVSVTVATVLLLF